MRRRLFAATVATAASIAAGAVTPAAPAQFSPVVVTRTCSAGYRHAVIGGVEKCLRAGEFCAHRYDRQYRRYGYRCIRYYPNVHRYRLTHA